MHAPAVLALDERLGAMLMEAIEPGTPPVVTSAYPALERIDEQMASQGASGGRIEALLRLASRAS